MNIKNPRYNAHGTIDMDIDHPVYGWIPFTASPDDAEAHGRELFELAATGQVGPVEAYTPPQPPAAVELLARARASASLTRREFFLGLDAMGMYDIVMGTELPRYAKIELDTATQFDRTWPTLVEMAGTLGVTDEQLDMLFGIEG